MKVLEEKSEGMFFVSPEAEKLDAVNSLQFKSSLIDLINKGGSRFALDFSDIKVMDSSGLAVLVSILKTLGSDGEIAIVQPTENIMKLFAITKLDSVFKILGSRDELDQFISGS